MAAEDRMLVKDEVGAEAVASPPAFGAIVGWGAALPPTVVSNEDLGARLETSDEWIRERTGIRSRHIGGTTAGLAAEAVAEALRSAGVGPADIDLLLLATTTPDVAIPATAAAVQRAAGLSCAVLDLNAACSGFVYGLVAAFGFLAVGSRRVVLVGSETLSRFTDPGDRSTAILLADGAGAVVIERSSEPGLLAWDLGADGESESILRCELGGYLRMQGREVFRRAVLAASKSATIVLKRAGVKPEDVSLFVPHQANLRMIEAIAQRVGISLDSTALVVEQTGNTSAASVPIALAEAAQSGRLADGDAVLCVGFGAGLTWGSALLRWSA